MPIRLDLLIPTEAIIESTSVLGAIVKSLEYIIGLTLATDLPELFFSLLDSLLLSLFSSLLDSVFVSALVSLLELLELGSGLDCELVEGVGAGALGTDTTALVAAEVAAAVAELVAWAVAWLVAWATAC